MRGDRTTAKPSLEVGADNIPASIRPPHSALRKSHGTLWASTTIEVPSDNDVVVDKFVLWSHNFDEEDVPRFMTWDL